MMIHNTEIHISMRFQIKSPQQHCNDSAMISTGCELHIEKTDMIRLVDRNLIN